MTNQRKDSHTPLTVTMVGFVVSSLLASCSGGGSPGVPPSTSADSVIGTEWHHRSPQSSPTPVAVAPTPTAKAVVPSPTPVPTARATTAPPAPDHVKNFAYYGQGNNINSTIPATYMAAHVDIIEVPGYTGYPEGPAFKAAGGKMAIAYVNPTIQYGCVPPFTEPAGACNASPIGVLLTGNAAAWIHGSTGTRLNSSTLGATQAEIVNPGKSSVIAAFQSVENTLLADDPHLDGILMDDSGSEFSIVPDYPINSGTLIYSYFCPAYPGSDCGVEITTDAQWQTAETALFNGSVLKIINNGGHYRGGPAYSGAFLSLSNSAGQVCEGCGSNGTGTVVTDANNTNFADNLNGMLQVQALRKLFLFMELATDVPSRTYAYAAFMLGYDPNYSVYAGQVSTLSDGEAVYPETQLVPYKPLTTATASSAVSVLLHSGVYVREFASCTIAKVSIGHCAALVNSTASTQTVPSLAQTYAHHIVLPRTSLYGGGVATVGSGTSSSVAAGSAAILVQ